VWYHDFSFWRQFLAVLAWGRTAFYGKKWTHGLSIAAKFNNQSVSSGLEYLRTQQSNKTSFSDLEEILHNNSTHSSLYGQGFADLKKFLDFVIFAW